MKPKRNPEIFGSVEALIHAVRGERVILDSDLALIYGVETKALNRAVRRTRRNFHRISCFN
jgi:hypothetical protein